MANLREIFAKNLREHRRKCGFSQEKLAEKADISTHYVTMLELARNFPASEVLERLANALNIEVCELLLVSTSPEAELERLHRTIIDDIRRTIEESVENAFAKRDREVERSLKE
jgi:transcriptional regulator with XRE-family HTH domain